MQDVAMHFVVIISSNYPTTKKTTNKSAPSRSGTIHETDSKGRSLRILARVEGFDFNEVSSKLRKTGFIPDHVVLNAHYKTCF